MLHLLNLRRLAALGLLVACAAASAQSASPVGLWKTIDDGSKTEKSLVRIAESDGVLGGHVQKVLDPATKPDAVCDQCTDERRGKPIVGLQIIRGVRKNADDAALWDGGDILDPANGRVYKVRLRPVDNGTKLEVRGYLGAPLFGRTQTWIRVE
jgi:uncharacterized protein (DUF2147 family)